MKNIEKEKGILKSLGFDITGKSFEDLHKLSDRYIDRTEFLKIVKGEAQRLGIPQFIPNPNPGVRPISALALRGNIPEGMMPTPQFLKLVNRMSEQRDQFLSYVDDLTELKNLQI